MRKKNNLTKKEMAIYAADYFTKHFKRKVRAAEHFSTSKQTIDNVADMKQPPNEKMLKAFGYRKKAKEDIVAYEIDDWGINYVLNY